MDFGAYHVVAPDRPAEAQIEYFARVCEGMRHLPDPVLDCEVARGMDRQAVTACIDQCADRVQDNYFCNPVIYTRQSWWD